jgi:hypothetical protein
MRGTTNRSAPAAMDAEARGVIASRWRSEKKQTNISGGFHEARADRIVAVDRITCAGAAGGAQHPI